MARIRQPETGFDVPDGHPASAAPLNAAASAPEAPAAPNPSPSVPPSEAGPKSGGKFNPAADHQAPPITAAMFAETERYRVSMTLDRLHRLSQVNADVKWLLEQYQAMKDALEG